MKNAIKEKIYRHLESDEVVKEIKRVYYELQRNLFDYAKGTATHYICVDDEGRVSCHLSDDCIKDDEFTRVITYFKDEFDEAMIELKLDEELDQKELESFYQWCEKKGITDYSWLNYKLYNEGNYEAICRDWWEDWCVDFALDNEDVRVYIYTAKEELSCWMDAKERMLENIKSLKNPVKLEVIESILKEYYAGEGGYYGDDSDLEEIREHGQITLFDIMNPADMKVEHTIFVEVVEDKGGKDLILKVKDLK